MRALLWAVLILVAIVLVAFVFWPGRMRPQDRVSMPAEHVYVSWDTMEFDKCVAVWLILRFIDKDAQFRFVPTDTEITQGKPFDIPGAEWSRKHRKCTSQCILESIKSTDPAVEKIVLIASRTELNFWQLDRWPDAQRCFYEVKEIMEQTPDPVKLIEKTTLYFDELYRNLRRDNLVDKGT